MGIRMKALNLAVVVFIVLLQGCGFVYSIKEVTLEGVSDKTIAAGAMVSVNKDISDTNLADWKK